MLDTETPAHVIALRNAGPAAVPRLRGYSHRIAALLSPLFVLWLIHRAPTHRAAVCASIYGVALVALFSFSGLYHLRAIGPRVRFWLGRIDHATILPCFASNPGSSTAHRATATGHRG